MKKKALVPLVAALVFLALSSPMEAVPCHTSGECTTCVAVVEQCDQVCTVAHTACVGGDWWTVEHCY